MGRTESWESGVKAVVGGVYVWVRTDSPTTPLPEAITASNTSHNCPQQQNQVIEEVGETRKVATHGFFPHKPRFDIPHPLSFGTMPFAFNVALP